MQIQSTLICFIAPLRHFLYIFYSRTWVYSLLEKNKIKMKRPVTFFKRRAHTLILIQILTGGYYL